MAVSCEGDVEPRVPYNAGSSLNSLGPVSFSGRTPLHGVSYMFLEVIPTKL